MELDASRTLGVCDCLVARLFKTRHLTHTHTHARSTFCRTNLVPSLRPLPKRPACCERVLPASASLPVKAFLATNVLIKARALLPANVFVSAKAFLPLRRFLPTNAFLHTNAFLPGNMFLPANWFFPASVIQPVCSGLRILHQDSCSRCSRTHCWEERRNCAKSVGYEQEKCPLL